MMEDAKLPWMMSEALEYGYAEWGGGEGTPPRAVSQIRRLGVPPRTTSGRSLGRAARRPDGSPTNLQTNNQEATERRVDTLTSTLTHLQKSSQIVHATNVNHRTPEIQAPNQMNDHEHTRTISSTDTFIT